MILEIQVSNLDNISLEPLRLPMFEEESEYFPQMISGLGPVKADFVTSSFPGIDVSSMQSSSLATRDIGLTIGFRPDWSTHRSYEWYRKHLHRYFMPETRVELKFILEDGVEMRIEGYVETHESNAFSRLPVSQISIACLDPIFQSNIATNTQANLSNTSSVALDYRGSVATGVLLEVDITGSMSGLECTATTPSGALTYLSMAKALRRGDRIIISTHEGAKDISIIRSGGSIETGLDGLSADSSWIKIFPGTNLLTIGAIDGAPSGRYTMFVEAKFGSL